MDKKRLEISRKIIAERKRKVKLREKKGKIRHPGVIMEPRKIKRKFQKGHKKAKYDFGHGHYDSVHGLKPFVSVNYNHDKPLFSFIAPAIRGYMYVEYYKNVYSRDIPFEIVFAGFNPPLKKMPDNFRYIKTDMNPGRCYEIAARMAVGKYLITSTDDLRYVKGFLSNISNHCNSLDMDKHIIYFGKRHEKARYVNKKPKGFYTANALIIKKSNWHSIGGLEKRSYEMGSCDWAGLMDIEFRLQHAGYKVHFANDCIYTEIERNWEYIGNTRRMSATWTICKRNENDSSFHSELNYGFWNSDCSVRMLPFVPYCDKDLGIEDQY